MDAIAKQLWTDALRSGDYEQGKGTLRENDKYCCLGVLCEVAIKDGVDLPFSKGAKGIYTYGDHQIELPLEVAEWAKLNGGDPVVGGTTAIGMNDADDMTFPEIANAIDTYL